jgi:hypothetical protein
MDGENRNVYRILAGKSVGKRRVGRLRLDRWIILKWIPVGMRWYGLNSPGLG